MRHLLFSFFLMIASSLTAYDPLFSGWDFYVGGLFLHRDRPQHAILVVSDTAALFDAHSFDGDFASGCDLRIKKKFATFYGEGRFFGKNHWEMTGPTIVSPSGLLAPATSFFPPPLLLESSCSPSYSSRLWNGETNLGYYVCATPVAFYAGYRILFLDESLRLDFPDIPMTAHLKVSNHLKGPQVGFSFTNIRLTFQRGPSLLARFSLSGFGASFKYDNHILAHYFFDLFPSEGDVEISSKGINAGIALNICLLRSIFASVGYEVLWIDQVATATTLLSQTNQTMGTIAIKTESILFQGLQVGMQLKW